MAVTLSQAAIRYVNQLLEAGGHASVRACLEIPALRPDPVVQVQVFAGRPPAVGFRPFTLVVRVTASSKQVADRLAHDIFAAAETFSDVDGVVASTGIAPPVLSPDLQDETLQRFEMTLQGIYQE